MCIYSQQTFVYLRASSGENFKWNPVYRTWNKDSHLLWCYTVSTGDSYRHFGRLYSFVFRIKQCNQSWNNGTAWSRRRGKYNWFEIPVTIDRRILLHIPEVLEIQGQHFVTGTVFRRVVWVVFSHKTANFNCWLCLYKQPWSALVMAWTMV